MWFVLLQYRSLYSTLRGPGLVTRHISHQTQAADTKLKAYISVVQHGKANVRSWFDYLVTKQTKQNSATQNYIYSYDFYVIHGLMQDCMQEDFPVLELFEIRNEQYEEMSTHF